MVELSLANPSLSRVAIAVPIGFNNPRKDLLPPFTCLSPGQNYFFAQQKHWKIGLPPSFCENVGLLVTTLHITLPKGKIVLIWPSEGARFASRLKINLETNTCLTQGTLSRTLSGSSLSMRHGGRGRQPQAVRRAHHGHPFLKGATQSGDLQIQTDNMGLGKICRKVVVVLLVPIKLSKRFPLKMPMSERSDVFPSIGQRRKPNIGRVVCIL